VKYLRNLRCKDKLLALPANITLRRKRLAMTNALAYYVTELITAIKKVCDRSSVGVGFYFFLVEEEKMF